MRKVWLMSGFVLWMAFIGIGLMANAPDVPLQYVAFVSYDDVNDSEGGSVYWLDIASSQIVTPPGLEEGFYCPLDWSPDRQWWVYAQQEDAAYWTEYVLNVATGEAFSFLGSDPNHSYFEWSPDSSHLVVTTNNNVRPDRTHQFQTYLVSTDTQEVEVIASGIGRTQFIRWFSETQFLQPTVDENNQIHLYRVEVSTAQIEEEIFTPDLERIDVRNISPDGTLLLLAAGITSRELYFLNIETGELSTIWDSEDRNGMPFWSPDGRWFAYSSYNEARPYREQGAFVFESVSSGETRSIFPAINGGFPYIIYWSPESQHAVLQTRHIGGSDPDRLTLDIADIQSGEIDQIASDLNIFAGEVNWIDETQLLFTYARAGSFPPAPNDIYLYNLNTQESQNLTNSDTNEFFRCLYG
jgi:Tol biopolymer transport system component